MKELLFTDHQQPSFVGLVVKELLFTDQGGGVLFCEPVVSNGVLFLPLHTPVRL